MSEPDAGRAERSVGVSPIPQDNLLMVIRENVDGMLVIGRDGIIMLANPAAERLLGQPSDSLAGTSFGAPLALGRATEIDVVAGGGRRTAEMRVVEIVWQETPAFLASLRDVTDRKLEQAALTRVGAEHEAIALLGTDAVAGLAPDALMISAATHVRRVLATDFAGVFAVQPDSDELRLVASDFAAATLVDRSAMAAGGSQPRYTLQTGESVVMNDARVEARFDVWPPGIASAATVLINDHERHFGVLEAASVPQHRFDRDEITFLQSVANLLAAALARFHAEDQVRHQALHDTLTGLPNRALFLDRLTHALARSRRQNTSLAVLFADLDGFKHVNDTLGHHAGDEVLVALATRLSDVLRSSDSLARFGGDEFMMLLEDVEGERELLRAVARVQQAVSATPFVIQGRPQPLDLTIGVVRADESHRSPDDLIRDADAAMYHAKDRGRGGYAIFDRHMRVHAVERERIEHALRSALEAGELRLHYQPIVSLASGHIVELEALLRWQHPERGLLGPTDFLDVAIETRLILPIGKWALSEACRQTAAWQAAELDVSVPTINVNLAPIELAQPDLRSSISAALKQGGAGVALQLELTEGALIKDPTLPATLSDLGTNLGVRTALDDFGTGYSSLAYLARFKIDELKIDRSFIHTLKHGEDAPIVVAIVSMAHALDIVVVAEGIETEEQATQALRLGCDRGQGYLFSRPLPADAMPALLAAPPTRRANFS